MARKRIKANFYMIGGYDWDKSRYEWKELPDGCLYSGWGFSHPTKITAEDLPEWYIKVTNYKKKGYIRTKGVSDIQYNPSCFHNHSFKDDFLFISYDGNTIGEEQFGWLLADEYIFGDDIVNVILGVEKYSDIDVSDIKMRMAAQYNAHIKEMIEGGWQKAISSLVFDHYIRDRSNLRQLLY